MSKEVACSYCHQPMPSTSVFCPHCGKAVDNAVNIASQGAAAAAPSKERQPGPTYNEQRQAAQRAAQRSANAWQQPTPPTDDDDDDDDNDGGGRSNFNRNIIIGIVALAVLIGLLSMLKHCNSRENDRLEARADS